jgi:hypothetical protein
VQLAEAKPASWTPTQKSPVSLRRAFRIPEFLTPFAESDFEAPAIDVFRAYASAFEKVAAGMTAGDAEISKQVAAMAPRVALAKLQVIDPAFKTAPQTQEQIQAKLRELDENLEKQLAKIYEDYTVEIKKMIDE